MIKPQEQTEEQFQTLLGYLTNTIQTLSREIFNNEMDFTIYGDPNVSEIIYQLEEYRKLQSTELYESLQEYLRDKNI